MRISKEALEEIRKTLDEYRDVCERQLNTKTARDTYYGYANRFVRWLNDDFDPGRMK